MGRICTATTASGQPCKAWAIREVDPALCSAHTGLLGAPKGNQNATKYGFYRSGMSSSEIADLLQHTQNMTLEDELAVARVMLQRLLSFLNQKQLDATELATVGPLVFTGTRTVALLLRDIESDGRSNVWDEVLDRFSEDLKIRL